MSNLRLLFDAMDADLLLGVYVTSLFLFTVWIGCRVIQMIWSSLEPHVYLWINFRKESDVRVVSQQPPATVSRMADPERRTVRQRVRADLEGRRHPPRPMWLADRESHRSGGDAA